MLYLMIPAGIILNLCKNYKTLRNTGYEIITPTGCYALYTHRCGI